MYRSRPKGSLDDSVLDFLSSMKNDQQILYYDIVGSQAHSIMLHEMGHISQAELKKILSALETARKKPESIETQSAEDIHEALEAFVIKHAGMDAGGKMHTARSRNDQVVLDIRMKVRDDINSICSSIINLIDGLLEKAAENVDSVMPLYTHTQQGQLGSFSHILLSYSDALFRDLERIYQSFGRINQSPLGACAIGGTSIKIDRKRTAVLLGFDSLVRNSVDATTSRDAFIEYVANLSILAATLARIAEDLIIWSTSEFGFIELADKYSSTSSAMPQKKNPDPLELARSKAPIVSGKLLSMLGIVKSLPSGYSRDLQDIKPLLIESSEIALNSVKIIDGVIRTLQVRKDRMKEVSNSSYAISLDVAEQLVTKQIPFRLAHKIVGGLVAEAAKKNAPLQKLESKDIESVLKAAKVELEAGVLAKIVKEMTSERSLELRTSEGSPNPAEQKKMTTENRKKLDGFSQGVQKRTKFIQGSFENLAKQVEKYTN